MAAMIGRQALEEYGYEEIIRRAVKAHFLRYPDPAKPHADNLVGQTMADAAREAWPVFTRWAVMAGITSQLDSPAPGPADVVAIGELVVGLVHAGAIAVMVLTMSSDSAEPTTTAIPIARRRPNQECPPCKLIDGTVVPVGMIAYRPMDTPPPGKVEHGISGPHYNLYKTNQNPNNCQCFWQPIGAVPPPPQPDWIPIQPFAN